MCIHLLVCGYWVTRVRRTKVISYLPFENESSFLIVISSIFDTFLQQIVVL